MRRVPSTVLLGFLLLPAVAPAAVLGTSSSPGAGDASVRVEDFTFTPAEVSVAVEGSVTWTIGADPEQHTVTPADGAAFEDSGQLFTGDTYVVRFDAPGRFEYLCTLHPFMTGTVTVVAAASPSAEVSAVPTVGGGASVVPSAAGATASAAAPSTSGASAAASAAVADPGGAATNGSPGVALVIVMLIGLLAAGGIVMARRRRGA